MDILKIFKKEDIFRLDEDTFKAIETFEREIIKLPKEGMRYVIEESLLDLAGKYFITEERQQKDAIRGCITAVQSIAEGMGIEYTNSFKSVWEGASYERTFKIPHVINIVELPDFAKTKTVCPGPRTKAPTAPKSAPLFTLKGSPDKEKATRIYTKLAGTYIDCSVKTFLHFFYDSAIKPDEVNIKWIYGRGKKDEGANRKLLYFIDLITKQSDENRPLANINKTFNKSIGTDTLTSDDRALRNEIKLLLRAERLA